MSGTSTLCIMSQDDQQHEQPPQEHDQLDQLDQLDQQQPPPPQQQGDGTKYTGSVARWNNSKGFGFITPAEGGDDIFVHQSELVMDGYRCLNEGEQVEYQHMHDDQSGRVKAHQVTGPGGNPLKGFWGEERPRSGSVARWRNDRGFGFITPVEGGNDIFVHQSVIVSTGFRQLVEGETVEYTIMEDGGKVKAAKVTGETFFCGLVLFRPSPTLSCLLPCVSR